MSLVSSLGIGMCQGAYTAQALFASFLAVTDQ